MGSPQYGVANHQTKMARVQAVDSIPFHSMGEGVGGGGWGVLVALHCDCHIFPLLVIGRTVSVIAYRHQGKDPHICESIFCNINEVGGTKCRL